MAAQPFKHRIEHTKNKHSRAVCKGNTIIIRLARNLSGTEEQEHIQSLLRRMTHLVLEEREKKMVDPFRHLLSGGQTQSITLATGKKYMFALVPSASTSHQFAPIILVTYFQARTPSHFRARSQNKRRDLQRPHSRSENQFCHHTMGQLLTARRHHAQYCASLLAAKFAPLCNHSRTGTP